MDNKIAKNMLWTYGRMAISVAIGLCATRLNVRGLGVDGLGAIGSVTAIIALLSIFQEPIASGCQRFLTAENVLSGIEARNKIFSLHWHFSVLLSSVIFALSIISYFLRSYICSEWNYSQLTWVSLCAALIITILIQPFATFAVALKRADISAAVAGGLSLASAGAAVSTYFISRGSIAAYSRYLVVLEFIFLFGIMSYFKSKFKVNYLRFHLNATIAKSIIKYSIFTLPGSIAWKLRTSGVILIIGKYFGPYHAGLAVIAMQIGGYYRSVGGAVWSASMPFMVENVAKKEWNQATKLAGEVTLLILILSAAFAMPFFLVPKLALAILMGQKATYAETILGWTLLVYLIEDVASGLNMFALANKEIGKYSTITFLIESTFFPLSIILLYLHIGMWAIFALQMASLMISTIYKYHFCRFSGMSEKEWLNNVGWIAFSTLAISLITFFSQHKNAITIIAWMFVIIWYIIAAKCVKRVLTTRAK